MFLHELNSIIYKKKYISIAPFRGKCSYNEFIYHNIVLFIIQEFYIKVSAYSGVDHIINAQAFAKLRLSF
jgi:hypothetical protein